MELAQLDVTLHYKFTEHWGGYLVMSGVNYSGGFLDRSIESFHDVLGFDDNGRPAVERNAVNLIADLNNADMAVFDAPTNGGLLDPTIGIRYSSRSSSRAGTSSSRRRPSSPCRVRRSSCRPAIPTTACRRRCSVSATTMPGT